MNRLFKGITLIVKIEVIETNRSGVSIISSGEMVEVSFMKKVIAVKIIEVN